MVKLYAAWLEIVIAKGVVSRSSPYELGVFCGVFLARFIAKLKEELRELGLGFIEREKTTIPLTPTKRFKCYYASNTKNKNKNLFNKDYTDPVKVKLQSLHVPLFAFNVREKKWILKKKIKAIELIIYPTP